MYSYPDAILLPLYRGIQKVRPGRAERSEDQMNLELIVFIVYILFVIGIGIYFFVKGNNASDKDYFLGGRRMGAWVAALSAGASDMSAWVLMGLPASIYALGMGQAWIAIGLAIGYAISWIVEAPWPTPSTRPPALRPAAHCSTRCWA